MQVLSGWSFTQPTTHNPLFPFFSILIMRWSLILSALIAVQSTISSVCVALPIPPQSEELERRSPAGVKLSSKQYRENSVKHPDAYHFTGLGPNGKLTSHATVTKEKLPSGTNYQHAQTLKNSPKENHAGMLLRNVRLPVLTRLLCSNSRSCLRGADVPKTLTKS